MRPLQKKMQHVAAVHSGSGLGELSRLSWLSLDKMWSVEMASHLKARFKARFISFPMLSRSILSCPVFCCTSLRFQTSPASLLVQSWARTNLSKSKSRLKLRKIVRFSHYLERKCGFTFRMLWSEKVMILCGGGRPSTQHLPKTEQCVMMWRCNVLQSTDGLRAL